jgi:integrase
MRHQQGYVWRKGRSWYGRWREDVLIDGRVVHKQRSRKLADYCDRYRSARDVQPLLDDILRPLNEGRATPESTMTVAQFVEQFFLPHADAELKPSTAHGYRELWKLYLASRLQRAILRDFRCADATALLADIHREHGVGRSTLFGCKRRLSAIFAYAKQQGVLDGINPIIDAAIPRKAAASKPTHAANPDEVMAMLSVLTGTARAAVALMYFAGLRPGEARGLMWQDYDEKGKRLFVRQSVWRTHTTAPKTAGCAAPVPVGQTLASILAQSRSSGDYILSGPSGKPTNLHNLARRVVKPALDKAGISWHGWYSLRRGAATLATQVESPLAAKGLLRHSNLATTTQHYVKDVPAETQRAIEKIDALFGGKDGELVQ